MEAPSPPSAGPFVGGGDAGRPLMRGWSPCVLFPLMGMDLQNLPCSCLVLVIHVCKRADPRAEVASCHSKDGAQAEASHPVGLHW